MAGLCSYRYNVFYLNKIKTHIIHVHFTYCALPQIYFTNNEILAALYLFILYVIAALVDQLCFLIADIYDYIWMSIPSVEDTSITVYYCADRYTFHYLYPCCGDRLVMRAGIKPAEASDSEWEYFNVLDVICNYDCPYLGYDNFSNYLIDGHTFNGLSKDETYTLKSELYFDYPYLKYIEEKRNITTLTKGIIHKPNCSSK